MTIEDRLEKLEKKVFGESPIDRAVEEIMRIRLGFDRGSQNAPMKIRAIVERAREGK